MFNYYLYSTLGNKQMFYTAVRTITNKKKKKKNKRKRKEGRIKEKKKKENDKHLSIHMEIS